MLPGGSDLVIRLAEHADWLGCLQATCQTLWPDAVWEGANALASTARPVSAPWPAQPPEEIFVFSDAKICRLAARWGCTARVDAAMVHILARPGAMEITIVSGEPGTSSWAIARAIQFVCDPRGHDNITDRIATGQPLHDE